jgi:prophage regulatory protein
MTHDPIWRLPDVMAYTGLARSTIYRKMSEDEFPQSVKLGPRAIGWPASSVEEWIQSCIDASRSVDKSDDPAP